MIPFTFTTTAVNRPDILDRTYNSFCSKLQGIDYKNSTLYINIDPVPEHGNINATLEIAKKYFGNVIYNIPEEPNFTKAVKWCWGSAESDLIFHLEDDWILNDYINIDDMLRIFKNNTKVLQIVLRAYKYNYDKMALSPSFINISLYKRFIDSFDTNKNPEIQLRDSKINSKNIYSYSSPKKYILVSDIGREWIENSGYKRPDKKYKFNKWIKKIK